MDTHAPARTGTLDPVNEGAERGKALRDRRLRLGIKSVREFADLAGLDRKAVGRAEKGEASETTCLRLEAYLDQRERATLEAHRGAGTREVSAVVVTGEQQEEVELGELIRVNITGPHADWRVSVEGPRGDGDVLSRIAADLADRLRRGDLP